MTYLGTCEAPAHPCGACERALMSAHALAVANADDELAKPISGKRPSASLQGGVSIKDRLKAFSAKVDESATAAVPKPVAPAASGRNRIMEFAGKVGKAFEAPAPETQPTGAVLKVGWLKRGGTGVLAAVYSRRFTILTADPMLSFFEDETRSRPKGTWSLPPGTTCTCSGADANLDSPADGGKPRVLKLREAATGEGADWWRALSDALSAAGPAGAVGPPTSAEPPTSSEPPEPIKTPPSAVMGAPSPQSSHVGQLMPQGSYVGQLMGGVELGGDPGVEPPSAGGNADDPDGPEEIVAESSDDDDDVAADESAVQLTTEGIVKDVLVGEMAVDAIADAVSSTAADNLMCELIRSASSNLSDRVEEERGAGSGDSSAAERLARALVDAAYDEALQEASAMRGGSATPSSATPQTTERVGRSVGFRPSETREGPTDGDQDSPAERERRDSSIEREMRTHARLLRHATEASLAVVAATAALLDDHSATKLQSARRAQLARANTKERLLFAQAAETATEAAMAEIDRAAAAADVIERASEMCAALPPRPSGSGRVGGTEHAMATPPPQGSLDALDVVACRLARLASGVGAPATSRRELGVGDAADAAGGGLARLAGLVDSIEESTDELRLGWLERLTARLAAASRAPDAWMPPQRHAGESTEAERLERMGRAVAALERIAAR